MGSGFIYCDFTDWRMISPILTVDFGMITLILVSVRFTKFLKLRKSFGSLKQPLIFELKIRKIGLKFLNLIQLILINHLSKVLHKRKAYGGIFVLVIIINAVFV